MAALPVSKMAVFEVMKCTVVFGFEGEVL